MNQRARTCVETLADAIEEDDDGGWKYSGDASRLYDYLMPILIENLDINPEGLLVSEGRVQSEINNLIVDVKQDDDPVEEFESQIDDVIDRVNTLEVDEYTVAFPLNFQRRQRDLLPDILEFDQFTFEDIDRGTWTTDWVPDYQNHDGDRRLFNLNQFLEKTPNEIDESQYTYWKTVCHARDEYFAVNHVLDALVTILGQLNYAIHYGRTQRHSSTSGPWPGRWADLRSPFILLVYQDDCYQGHYFPEQDASYRKADGPHSMMEDQFEHVLEWLPTFETDEPIDPRLKRAFEMYQSGIINPQHREAFFEFWRGIEILSSIDDFSTTEDDDAIAGIVERVRQLFEWENPEIAELRLTRIANKRNEYVHEGGDVSIERVDRNLTKTLLEGVIDFACDKRTEWNVGDWKYVLENFESRNDVLDDRQRRLSRKIELLEEMKEFGED